MKLHMTKEWFLKMAKLEMEHDGDISAGIPDDILLDAAFRCLRKLVWQARTSGGVAGPDEGLMAACEEAEELIVSHGSLYGKIGESS